MARRLGITHDDVLVAAFAIVDSDGLDALSITAAADALGVRPPSLYSHVDGLPGLLDDLATKATAEFGDALRDSVDQRSGDDAIVAFADAYRSWATRVPGRYELTLRAAADSDARRIAGQGALDTMNKLLAGYGLTGSRSVGAGRSLRAALHGFVTLEAADNLGRGSHDASFSYLIGLILDGIRSPIRNQGA